MIYNLWSKFSLANVKRNILCFINCWTFLDQFSMLLFFYTHFYLHVVYYYWAFSCSEHFEARVTIFHEAFTEVASFRHIKRNPCYDLTIQMSAYSQVCDREAHVVFTCCNKGIKVRIHFWTMLLSFSHCALPDWCFKVGINSINRFPSSEEVSVSQNCGNIDVCSECIDYTVWCNVCVIYKGLNYTCFNTDVYRDYVTWQIFILHRLEVLFDDDTVCLLIVESVSPVLAADSTSVLNVGTDWMSCVTFSPLQMSPGDWENVFTPGIN